MGDETGMTELAKHQGAAPLAKASEERKVPMWLSKLTPPQAKALRELLAGARTQEAADAAGVDRVTLYRWRTQDPQFMAALSAWRNETHEHAMDQFLALSEASVAGGGAWNCRMRFQAGVAGTEGNQPDARETGPGRGVESLQVL